MNEPTRQIVVVVGLDPEGRPRGAQFPGVEEALVQRAAIALGYKAIRVTTADGLELARLLPVGRIYRTATSLAPPMKQHLYDQLVKLAPASAQTRGSINSDAVNPSPITVGKKPSPFP